MVQSACSVSKYDLLNQKGAKGTVLRGKGVKLVQTAKAHKTKGRSRSAFLCSLRLVKSQRIVHLAPNKISILFSSGKERRMMKRGERERGRGGEKLLSRAAFQFMLIRWPVQYASYMQMSRLHVPPIFRQLPAPFLSFSPPLAT